MVSESVQTTSLNFLIAFNGKLNYFFKRMNNCLEDLTVYEKVKVNYANYLTF